MFFSLLIHFSFHTFYIKRYNHLLRWLFVGGVHISGNGSNGVSASGEKCPRTNWSQHVKAHANFSNQDKFLSSNFLFSLSTQKPCLEDAMAVRYAIYSSLDMNIS